MNTEAEARELWCPMVRAASGEEDSNACNAGTTEANRVFPFSTCIASQCAMWRWDSARPRRYFIRAKCDNAEQEEFSGGPWAGRDVPAGWKFCPAEDDIAGWIEPESAWLARRTGYCGLAGKPGSAA